MSLDCGTADPSRGVKFRLGGIRFCLRSVFPPQECPNMLPGELPAPGTRPAPGRIHCRAGTVVFLYGLQLLASQEIAHGSGSSGSAAKREQIPARSGSRRSQAGAGAAGQPRRSWAGACQQLGSSFSMRQQLGAGPAQPICCCCHQNLDLSDPRGRGCAEILPLPPPAKCCNPSVVIPAWCCDTDAQREIQAPASSHSRGCCSSPGALREPLQRFGPCPALAVCGSAG